MVQVLERDPLLLRTYSSSNILLNMSLEYLVHHRYGLQLIPHDQLCIFGVVHYSKIVLIKLIVKDFNGKKPLAFLAKKVYHRCLGWS